MDQARAREESAIGDDGRGEMPEPKAASEPQADPLNGIAVDANALAGAIWSGQGTDVGKLIEDLLRDRPAA